MTIETQNTITDIVLSDRFDVLQTQFGRACFASQDIPKGTDILITSSTPFGYTIIHEFRKEVCAFCLTYKFGTYCKARIPKPESYKGKKWLGCGLWFCSDQCVDSWRRTIDRDDKLSLVFESLLVNFQQKFKNNQSEEDYDGTVFKNVNITKEFIDSYWESVNDWEKKLEKMKQSKKASLLPYINEDDFATVRFVTGILFNIYQDHTSLKYFHSLQSNEVQKIQKYPVLLQSLEAIYKFLKISLPDYLQSLLTIDLLREIVGREFGNSFGIWQINENSFEENSENKEFLGYMLHPEASFLNHSCSPNVKKYRVGNKMNFKTMYDIKKGEQLCIDYYHVLDDPYQERRRIMMENWFFQCSCERCVDESKLS